MARVQQQNYSFMTCAQPKKDYLEKWKLNYVSGRKNSLATYVHDNTIMFGMYVSNCALALLHCLHKSEDSSGVN